MILEKVYDELYGMIEDLKKKVAGISGGSTVTITPALQSGTKVADYSIDGTEGSLYAPTPVGLTFASTETEVGSFDGKPLYSRIFSGEWTQTLSGNQWLITDIPAASNGIDFIFSAYMITAAGILAISLENQVHEDHVGVTTVSPRTFTEIALLYTKPTVEAKKTKKK